MRHRWIVFLAGILAACSPTDDPFTGDDDDAPAPQADDAQTAWTTELAPSRHPLLRMDDLLIAMADAGGVTTLDAATGAVGWEQSTDPIDVPFSYARDQDYVLLPEGATATFFLIETGERGNRYRQDDVSRGLMLSSTPSSYAVTYLQYQYDIGWAEQHDERGRTSYVRHDVDGFTAPPIPLGDDALVSGGTWLTRAQPTLDNDAPSEETWRTEIGFGAAWAPEQVDDSVVLAGVDGDVARVNVDDGSRLWTYRGGWPLANGGVSIDADAGIVAVPHNDGEVVALDLDTGAILWRVELADDLDGGVTAAGNRVYAASVDGTLTVLDAKNGEEIAAVWLDAEFTGRPLLVDDLVVLSSAAGTVYGVERP